MIKIKDKEFKIVIEHKRIKNIYLHFVYPDTIRVTCDFNVKEDFIMKLIESKKEWIYKASQRKELKTRLEFFMNVLKMNF